MAYHLNVEIKARTAQPEFIREVLQKHGADFKGTDMQTDTYFQVPQGRLKLRQGNIENSLIYYERADDNRPKSSDVWLYKTEPQSGLHALLSKALGVKVTVQKRREIYFIDNVKFHIDELDALGAFVEIEAIDLTRNLGHAHLQKQCNTYMELLHISPSDLITHSYSDMLLKL